MDAPAPASKRYDLFFQLSDQRFTWRKQKRCGVTIIDAGRDSRLTWTNEGRDESRLWTDIIAVTMISVSDGRNEVNKCGIRFRGGRVLTVTDGDERGSVDHDRTPVYRDFVRALHARLAAAPPGTITFAAGVSEMHHLVMKIILLIAVLLFVVTPLGLVLFLGEWRALFPLAAGAAFVWPYWNIVQNNKPRSYDPRNPPGELMD
jgi:hypothetical protein